MLIVQLIQNARLIFRKEISANDALMDRRESSATSMMPKPKNRRMVTARLQDTASHCDTHT